MKYKALEDKSKAVDGKGSLRVILGRVKDKREWI
jgi:hypothetical protein